MIVVCEKCGKKYQIDTGKIKETTAKFKCRSCLHFITVKLSQDPPALSPALAPPPSSPAQAIPPAEDRTPASGEDKPEAQPKEKKTQPQVKPEKIKPAKPKSTRAPSARFGLRLKMAIFFFVIPLIFIAVSGLFYLRELNALSRSLTAESAGMVERMAEEIIAENAREVASQCRVYLMTHPHLMKEAFTTHPDFQKIAVQKVGETGYTALYELPGPDGIWRTRMHVNLRIIDIDMSTLKEPLGKSFAGFWKVFTGVAGGKESSGSYVWQEKDGRMRDKYMVCTPVAGTPFVIASTTYLDELTRPMKLVESRAEQQTQTTRNILFAILGATIVTIGAIVLIYGNSLTGRIRSLTDVADRISMGELDAEIHIRSGDEIGDLGDAISRMQESIRISIERLRRRR